MPSPTTVPSVDPLVGPLVEPPHDDEKRDTMTGLAPSFTGSTTEANLRAALANEAAAAARYQFYAEQADVVGQPEVAELFRRLSAGEAGHASDIVELLAEYGANGDDESLDDPHVNLRSSLAAERRDATEIYPAFATAAITEGFEEIGAWFQSLARAEGKQADRLDAMLAADRSQTGDDDDDG